MAGAGGPITLESLDARLIALAERLENTRNVTQTKFSEVDDKALEQDDAIEAVNDSFKTEMTRLESKLTAKCDSPTKQKDELINQLQSKFKYMEDEPTKVRNSGGSTATEAAKNDCRCQQTSNVW